MAQGQLGVGGDCPEKRRPPWATAQDSRSDLREGQRDSEEASPYSVCTVPGRAQEAENRVW